MYAAASKDGNTQSSTGIKYYVGNNAKLRKNVSLFTAVSADSNVEFAGNLFANILFSSVRV